MKFKNSFEHMDNQELLKLYRDLMEELKKREITRSSNNPVADYAEKIAVEHLGLIRAGKQAKGYDAIDQGGAKYQIKGRRLTMHNQSRQLGVIRNLDEELFDYVIAVIFHDYFSINDIWKIPRAFIKENARFSSLQNGHVFTATLSLLSKNQGVKRIR